MRVVFAGTPPFAATALAALHAAGHDIPLVLTQPDRPAGRGMKLAASATAQWAQAHDLPVLKPPTLKEGDALAQVEALAPDVMVVAAYGLILPRRVLSIPRHGCLNIHASLLPRWRGAAPIQRALLAGDRETGVCIMQMEAGLDTGPVILEKRLPITGTDTTGSLTLALADLGATAIVEALARLHELQPMPQDSDLATYAAKIVKSEARIDWMRSAPDIERQVRAFNPVPGAETELQGQPLKVWRAALADGSGPPGSVLYSRNSRLVVGCGSGALELLEIQRPGARRMAVGEFTRGTLIDEGSRLGDKPLASA